MTRNRGQGQSRNEDHSHRGQGGRPCRLCAGQPHRHLQRARDRPRDRRRDGARSAGRHDREIARCEAARASAPGAMRLHDRRHRRVASAGPRRSDGPRNLDLRAGGRVPFVSRDQRPARATAGRLCAALRREPGAHDHRTRPRGLCARRSPRACRRRGCHARRFRSSTATPSARAGSRSRRCAWPPAAHCRAPRGPTPSRCSTSKTDRSMHAPAGRTSSSRPATSCSFRAGPLRPCAARRAGGRPASSSKDGFRPLLHTERNDT